MAHLYHSAVVQIAGWLWILGWAVPLKGQVEGMALEAALGGRELARTAAATPA
jgi:hypothetical protein